MTDVSNKKKDSVLKTLAVAGFIGIIILIAWVSIQLINVIPGTFSSLASLAGSMNQYQETIVKRNGLEALTVTSNATLINVGEQVELSWATTKVPGSYTFAYQCSEGVSVDIVNVAGIGSINCDTNYNIGDVDSLSILISSEKERYADVDYTISFLATNDTEPRAGGSASITVVNSEISNIIAENNDNEETVEAAAEEPEVETVTEELVIPEVGTPVYEQEFVYTIPTSDPNGRTDLSTKFLNTGTIVGNSFFAGVIKQEETGAIQFEVKNYGTKTSDKWSYEVTLPGSGVYESPELAPLKPNERAVLTVGFPTTDKPTHTFKVTIDENTDRNTSNDQFSQFVVFLK